MHNSFIDETKEITKEEKIEKILSDEACEKITKASRITRN